VRIVALALAVFSAAGCRFVVGAAGDSDLAASGDVDLAGVDPSDLDVAGDLPTPADLGTAPDLLVAGILSGTRVDMPSTVDLSGEGLSDWAHYGLAFAGDVDHKSGVTASLKMTSVGVLRQWSFFTPSTTWSGGTPTASGNTTSGVYINGVGSSLSVAVPADATTRTLRLYLSQYQSTCKLVAHLSDGSAPDYTMTNSIGNTNVYHRYTLSFRSSRPGETLTVTWTLTSDAGGGDVDLMAATYF
jgi:hypothetical protein